MFWGEYSHHLDKKGRVIVPAKFREKLTDKAILTRGLDRNLVIYPEDAWQSVTSQLNEIPITHPTGRALRRLLFSGAAEVSLDNQGRLLIPQYLREYASLDDTVLMVGMENFIELWEPACWLTALDGVTTVLADNGHTLSLSL